ncbi:MAG: undecaprenyldiphospho-muramoylpentapeptide beta-N-acetylglucosaminyltransferase [Candidatus Falkowbacteria bacterium]
MAIKNKKNVKILLTGGGTGGSVTPLLAIIDKINIQYPISNILWLGTKNGPEKNMLKNYKNIKFKYIFSGKLRRYFSFRNFIDPFFIILGFFQSLAIMLIWRPNLVMSAGSFVSVPVVWASWILRVPVLIHQQDARPGLANKLMAPFAKVITVTFEKSLRDYGNKAVWLGNFIRKEFNDYKISKNDAIKKLGLNNNKPIILVIGGGTGASVINKLIEKNLSSLTKFCQILHIVGKNKKSDIKYENNYHPFEFMHIDGLIKMYTASDIVISRAGMGSLTELSYLGKSSILIPMPNSHQEDNARIFKEKNAAIVLDQKKLTPEKLTNEIKKLLDNKMLRDKLSNNIKTVIKKGAWERIIKIIEKLTNKKMILISNTQKLQEEKKIDTRKH